MKLSRKAVLFLHKAILLLTLKLYLGTFSLAPSISKLKYTLVHCNKSFKNIRIDVREAFNGSRRNNVSCSHLGKPIEC